MPVIVVALTTINEDNLEALGTYIGTTAPLLEQAGARIIGRYSVNRTVVGPANGDTVTIVEYPSRAAVESVFESAEYGWLQDIRAQAFLHYQIMVLDSLDDQADLTPLMALNA